MKDIVDNSYLQDTFRGLLFNGKNSDVTFVTSNDDKFSVHRDIIAAHSEFFQKLFYENPFKEGDAKEIKIEATSEAFGLVLKFLYTGSIELTSQGFECILQVLELAHRFGLSRLEDVLIDNFDETVIKRTTLPTLIKSAMLLGSYKLIRTCWEYVDAGLFSTPAFLELGKAEVLYFLSNQPHHFSEVLKLNGVSRWIAANHSCLDKEGLINVVDFAKLSQDQSLKTAQPKQRIFRFNENDSAQFMCTNLPIVDGTWEIILDFGEARAIFNINFFIIGEDLYDFTLEFSQGCFGCGPWNNLKNLQLRHGEQNIFFKQTVNTKAIKIRGLPALHSITLNKPATVVTGRSNKINLKTAFARDKIAKVILEMQDKIENNATLNEAYCEIPAEGVRIYFNQPYEIKTVVLGLRNASGRKQSCEIATRAAHKRWDTLKVFNSVGTHEKVELVEGRVVSEIKITPTEGTTLRLSHFGAF